MITHHLVIFQLSTKEMCPSIDNKCTTPYSHFQYVDHTI